MNGLKPIANFISYVFHPIFIPTMALLYLCWCNPYRYVPYGSKEFVLLCGVVVANSVFFPLIIIAIFKGLHIINSIQMKEKAERVFPFMIIIFFSSVVATFSVSPILMISILIAGCIGSARLLLDAHHVQEIYWGYFLGFFCTIFSIFSGM